MSLFHKKNPFKSSSVRNENIDIWTCGMCGNEFPVTINPHLVYEGNNDTPVNIICDSCDQLRDEGP